jgi:hypothetical protein
MTDTDPKAADEYWRLLMARTDEERFLMGVRMCESARLTVLASLPRELNSLQRKIALLHRYYASDLDESTLECIELALAQKHMPTPSTA